MEQQGHDGTEGVEEQVTKEMKEALEGNGFINGTIEMATRAAMAVMKGEVFEGLDGEQTDEAKLKSAEKKRRLRELMEPGATPYIRAENQAEKELEQTKYIGRKWREKGPKGPGYYLSFVAVAGQLLALADKDEITELVQHAAEGRDELPRLAAGPWLR